MRFARVLVGRLEGSRCGEGTKRGVSRAGVAGETGYISSRFIAEKRGDVIRLSDVECGSKRPASSNRGVSWKGAPGSSSSKMRGLTKSWAKSSFLGLGVRRKSSKGDSMGEVMYSLCCEESPRVQPQSISNCLLARKVCDLAYLHGGLRG